MNTFCYTLHCNRYKCLETSNKKEYAAAAYTQSGVHHESVKIMKTRGALSMIDAMETKTELRAMKNQTITTTSKVHRKKWTYPTKRHTKSQRTESSSNKCNCQISILLRADSYFYRDARYTNLHHKGIHMFHLVPKNWDLVKFQTSKLSLSSSHPRSQKYLLLLPRQRATMIRYLPVYQFIISVMITQIPLP